MMNCENCAQTRCADRVEIANTVKDLGLSPLYQKLSNLKVAIDMECTEFIDKSYIGRKPKILKSEIS